MASGSVDWDNAIKLIKRHIDKNLVDRMAAEYGQLAEDKPHFLRFLYNKGKIDADTYNLVAKDLKIFVNENLQATLEGAPKALEDLPIFDTKRYSLVEEIGRGAMGVVSKYLDTRLGNKELAVKCIPSKRVTPDRLARFQREIELTALFDDHRVIRALDLGYDSEKNLYFVMEFVHGSRFTDIMNELSEEAKRSSLYTLLEYVASMLEGLSIIHEKKIIHRDIKPDNVMVVGDYVKIMDFGLAKVIGGDEIDHMPDYEDTIKETRLSAVYSTAEGTVLGTPVYMSQEQAIDSVNVDGRTDVYAVGAILYEILVGEQPHTGKTVHEVLKKKVKEPVIPPSQRSDRLYEKIHPALEAICMKALEKKQKRYKSAREFADDIYAFLNDEPVSAYSQKETFMDRVSRYSKKKPGMFWGSLAGGGGALLLAAAIGIGAAAFTSAESKRAIAETEAARKETLLEKERADRVQEKADSLEQLAQKEKEKREAVEKQREAEQAMVRQARAATANSEGIVLYSSGRWQDALLKYEEAISVDPYYLHSYNNRAKLYYELSRAPTPRSEEYLNLAKKDIDTALKKLNESVNSENDSKLIDKTGEAYLYFVKALVYTQKHLFAEVKEAYAQALLLSPDNLIILVEKGSFHMSQQEYNAAAEIFSRVLELRPDHTPARYSCIQSNLQLHNLREAEKHARVLFNARDRDSWFYLGKILYQKAMDSSSEENRRQYLLEAKDMFEQASRVSQTRFIPEIESCLENIAEENK